MKNVFWKVINAAFFVWLSSSRPVQPLVTQHSLVELKGAGRPGRGARGHTPDTPWPLPASGSIGVQRPRASSAPGVCGLVPSFSALPRPPPRGCQNCLVTPTYCLQLPAAHIPPPHPIFLLSPITRYSCSLSVRPSPCHPSSRLAMHSPPPLCVSRLPGNPYSRRYSKLWIVQDATPPPSRPRVAPPQS